MHGNNYYLGGKYVFSNTCMLLINWIFKIMKQQNTLVTEIEKGRSYGSQKTMMISIKIVRRETDINITDKCCECSCTLRHKISIINAKKKWFVQQILKETENQDSQDAGFFLLKMKYA